MQMTRRLGATFALAAVTVLALPATGMAGDSNGNFQVRVGVTGIVFDDNVKSVDTSTGVNLKSGGADAEVGNIAVPTATLTYFFNPHVAVELICCTAQIKVKGTGSLAPLGDLAEAWVLPPILTAQYRFDRFGGLQPYLGVGVQWIHYWGGTADNALGATDVKFDDSFGFVLQVGVDYDLGSGWSLDLDAKKAWVDTTVTWQNNAALGGADVIAKTDVDPLWLTASLGYRFNIEDLFARRSAPGRLK